MEYQKIGNLLNNESNKPSKFKTRYWVEIIDEARGTYSPNKQIKFKTPMLRSSLYDYGDAYIPVKGNITVNNNCDGAIVILFTSLYLIIYSLSLFLNSNILSTSIS